MAKKEVVIVDSKKADEIIRIINTARPNHICGCFGSKCNICQSIDDIIDILNKKIKIIAESGDIDLNCSKIYIKNANK